MFDVSEEEDLFAKHQWLINDPNQVENDALLGIVQSNPNVAMLDIGRVVIRRDHRKMEKVKILSGGPSGHEPTYAGFVGKGMLTAAVQGPIFSSPSPDLILDTIKELSRGHELGILVIVDDKISDRLNFGLAVERANNIENIRVRTIFVPNKNSKYGALCAPLILQKIASAMSELDFYLSEIHSYCTDLLNGLSSVVVSIKNAESPNLKINSCVQKLPSRCMEIDPDLQGKRGITVQLMSAEETAKAIVEKFRDSALFTDCNVVVMLINNLGGTSKTEEFIFLKEIISQTREIFVVQRIYCGHYMTSIGMAGFSVTLLRVNDPKTLDYLDAPCSTPHWIEMPKPEDPQRSLYLSSRLLEVETRIKRDRGPFLAEPNAQIIKQALTFICNALISCERQLNIIDSEQGDADTGTNIKKFACTVLIKINNNRLKLNWPFELLQQLSKLSERCMEGAVSCLYSVMFEAAAKIFMELEDTHDVTAWLWLDSLLNACDALKRYGKVELGEGTMYDAIYACTEAFSEGLHTLESWIEALEFAVDKTEKAAARTKPAELNHPDPGAHIVGIWMRAMYESIKFDCSAKN